MELRIVRRKVTNMSTKTFHYIETLQYMELFTPVMNASGDIVLQVVKNEQWKDVPIVDEEQGMSVGDITSNEKGTGARYNSGKAEYSQIPLHLLEGAAKVFMYGEKKYAKFNWMKGMNWSVPYDCLMRHMFAWYRGEEADQESLESHLDHAIANLLMLKLYAQTYKEGDNRPPKELFNAD